MKKIYLILIQLVFIHVCFGQDVIFLDSGVEFKAKVLEIKDQVVTYKKFDNLQGPEFQIPRKDVFMIKYENGTKDVFGIDEESNKEIDNLSQVDICKKATQDAITFYKPTKPMIGTYIPSMLAMPAGLITAAIVAPRTPKIENLNIHDQDLLQNEDYMKCYVKQSKKMKKKGTWLAFLSGWAAGMAIASIVMTTN